MNILQYPAIGETVYETELANGLKIVVAKKPGFQRAFAMFAANYGGADRRFRLGDDWIDTPWGVAHFLEHKMFDMPDGSNVLADLSARGASPNAYTSEGMTAYHFTCTDGFMENLRTLLTFVSTPWYTAESVGKEQGIIGQEIRMYEDSPDSVVYYELMKLLYAHHPIRDNVAGTVESIARITPEVLYICHKVFYHPSNMVLCCVGDVDPEAVAAMAEEILTKEPGVHPVLDYGPPEGPDPVSPRSVKTMPVAAPLFYIGAKLESPGDGPAQLRQQLLGDLALEYLVGTSSAWYTGLYAKGLLGQNFGAEIDAAAGTVTLLLGGESREPEAVLDALCTAVGDVAARGVDPETFERCRRARYGAELWALDHFSYYARILVRGAFEGWRPADVFPLLEDLTAEDAAVFLCRALAPQRLAMSVVAAEA